MAGSLDDEASHRFVTDIDDLKIIRSKDNVASSEPGVNSNTPSSESVRKKDDHKQPN